LIPVDLVVALHLHQPVGNFDHVFEAATRVCYHPLLEHLAEHPQVKFGLHVSGPLLDWLEKSRPSTLDLIGRMIDRDQVEIMGGGLYEPLLASIPPQDAVGQLKAMNGRLQKLFGRTPTGFWLTERVWTPEIPVLAAEAGLEYTFVDDAHFRYAGLSPEQTIDYRLTEKSGRRLALLPTSQKLRYLIPFRPVDEVIDHLLDLSQSPGPRVALYGDDGEKFGLWPKTREWVYGGKWLARFLDALDEHRDRIRTPTPSEFLAGRAPAGRVYLPTASYAEMGEWALPAAAGQNLEDMEHVLQDEGRLDEWRPFIRGGIWDNFLVKYPESNLMHKKMLRLSRLVRKTGVDPDELYQAQCNCAFWHGLFGGLYLPHLRHGVHQHLIAGLKTALGAEHGQKPWQSVEESDLTVDGHREILLDNPHLGLVLRPDRGGHLIAWDAKDFNFCLTNTLGRRPETYHRRLGEKQAEPIKDEADGIASVHDLTRSKEVDLAGRLVYDRYPRHSLVDHFLSPTVTPFDFAYGKFRQRGDFVSGDYDRQIQEKGDQIVVTLTRRGLAVSGEAAAETEVVKKITVGRGPGWEVDYQVRGPAGVNLAIELNLTLLSGEGPDRYLAVGEGDARLMPLHDPDTAQRVSHFRLVNHAEHFAVTATVRPAVGLWLIPIETVSMSESGFERIHQGVALVLIKDLPASGKLDLSLAFEVGRIGP
jgi:alpha-amylase